MGGAAGRRRRRSVTQPAGHAATRFHIVTVNGRRLLRFTSILVNVGAGPMEIEARRPSTSSPWQVRQVIDDDAGGQRRVDTEATLRYSGDGHNHWHVEKMMGYHL